MLVISDFLNRSSVGMRIAVISAALMVITGAPYLYAYLHAPAGGVYTGLHALTPGDFNVYFTQMRQAAEGSMAHNLYAGADGAGSTSMVNYFWWLLGKASQRTGLSIPLTFHLARLALVPAFVAVLAALLRLLVPARRHALAWLTVIFSSGVGYFAYPFLQNAAELPGRYEWPLDLWVPEANTFLTLMHSPHLLASLILFLGVLTAFLRAHTSRRPTLWYAGAGMAAGLLFLFHPFHAPTLAAVLAAWTALLGRRALGRNLSGLMVIGILSLPSIVWHAGRMLADPLTAEWARQNVTETPSWGMVAIGYGALIPLAFFALWARHGYHAREHAGTAPLELPARDLLFSWLLVHVLLVMSPLPFQRRLFEGMHLPLALLATEGLANLFAYIAPGRHWVRRAAVAGVWAILVMSSLGTLSRDLALFSAHNPFMYLTHAQRDAFYALENSREEGVVLAGITSANFIPAWTGRTVYGAPGAFSPQFEEVRRGRIAWFLAGTGTQAERKEFVRAQNLIEAVVMPWDGINAHTLDEDPLLEKRLSEGGVSVYHVILPE